MLLEAMGLHVPGTAFVNPGSEFRDELTREAVRTVLGIVRGKTFTPIGRLIDERAIVNAMVALLATGGSTNHLIHWVAVARAAGISINWDDFCNLSDVVPLIARVYPNGEADVNAFQEAAKEYEFTADSSRYQYCHSSWFLVTCKVVKITVRPEREFHIPVSDVYRCRRNDGDGFITHHVHQALSATGKLFLVHQ